MYRYVDAVLVRAATRPTGMDLPTWPDVTGSADDDVRQWCDWLASVWSRSSFAEAIEVASPVLARQVRKVCDGHCQEPRRVRRVVMSVARYVLRMTGRATPFGLFAGVAPAELSGRLTVRWGEDHRVLIRPDAGWLAAVISGLESCSPLSHRLSVVVNDLCFARGDRLVAPHQQHVGDLGEITDQAAPVEVSVRRTRAVEAVVRHARSPIVLGDLAGKLATDFPRTSAAVIELMLAELVKLRLLVTELRPPMTVTDPLGHVIGRLTAVDADEIPEIADQVRELRAIREDMSRHDHATSQGARRSRRVQLDERMRRIGATVEPPFSVDLRIDADIVLPEEVAHEAEVAATALTRLTPYPFGLPAWEDYHAAFIERYGTGAMVPILEVIDPDIGLGLPATYRGSVRAVSASSLSGRDERLIALAYTTVMEGKDEIVLDDRAVSGLMAESTRVRRVPPHVELFVQVHATSPTALARSEFELVVTGASRAAGTTTGRFLDLLDPSERDRMRRAYTETSVSCADALPVQVSCPPVYARSEGVARAPAVWPHLVSVAEHPDLDRGTISLDDLAVTGDADGLRLVSLSKRRPVEPTVLNAVEFRNFSHPVARFLCEITRARAAVYMPFSWGAADSLPFLPRVRYGRTVLAPARWNLSASDLPDRNASWPRWKEGMAGLRRRFRLPVAVHLGEADNLLPLNLDEDMHLALLRSHLDRRGRATLYEAPGIDAYGWSGGRAHEVVVPLSSDLSPVRVPYSARSVRSRRIGRDHGHLPGHSEWLFAKLYGHPDRQAELLSHVPDLLSAWQIPPQWWYVRYRDPEPHLRLRLRLPDLDAYGPAARRVGSWAADLRRLGLVGPVQFDTYHPEVGRYGGGAAMNMAESVFAADSVAALVQITQTASGVLHPHAVIAASLVDIATALTGSIDDGMRWLVEHVPKDSVPLRASREVHAETMRLADPRDQHVALRRALGGERIVHAWRRRASALTIYHDALSATDDISTDSVLASLLHMHHIRVVGVDTEIERMCLRLARSVALGWAARSKGAQR